MTPLTKASKIRSHSPQVRRLILESASDTRLEEACDRVMCIYMCVPGPNGHYVVQVVLATRVTHPVLELGCLVLLLAISSTISAALFLTSCQSREFLQQELLDTLDHLGVDQRVISLLIESNRPRACFGERRERDRERERCRSI